MKVFLAGTSSSKKIPNLADSKYNLESFYSFSDWQKPLLKSSEMFMLDSGAFTFMNGSKKADFNSYLDSYIDFINCNDIKYFFELDLDSVIGYSDVILMRRKLEQKTGKQCIPVWHKSRGKKEFIKMCEEYSYVAIGGIVTKEIQKTEYKFFPWFIQEAHSHGCKIHGLGFTSLKELNKYHFDSVDSTSWLSGGRFGQFHIYKDGTIKTLKKMDGKRAIHEPINRHNFNEWVKFQKYAETHL